MSFSYVARQPILNTAFKKVGYELLFRDGPDNSFPDVDPNLATSKVLIENIIVQTNKLYNEGDKFFINFPYESLVCLIPTLFDKSRIIIEILEQCAPTDELFNAVRHMRRRGYVFALDDFIPGEQWRRFYPYISIIKLDIRQTDMETCAKFIAQSSDLKVKFLAEKVETKDEYEAALSAGFKFFQGYYFSKPEVIKSPSIKSKDVTALMLLAQLKSSNFSFKRLEKIMITDAALSYQLLSFVNHRFIRGQGEIKSFHQALVYLGETNIRKFLSLIVMANTSRSKPETLFAMSLERAYMCEQLAMQSKHQSCKDEAFMVGLFSLLESFFEYSIEDLVENLPISESAKHALINRDGIIGEILETSIAYSEADWQKLSEHSKNLHISEKQIIKSYLSAVDWTDESLSIL